MVRKIRQKLFFVLMLAIFSLISINIISAEIMLSQPNEIYNLGDRLDVSATLKTSADSSGLFKMSITCGTDEKEFYVMPIEIISGEEGTFDTALTLSNSFLQDMKGKCRIKAQYLDEDSYTTGFEITDKINIELKTNNAVFNPEENIFI